MGVRVFLVCVSVCVGGCVREGEESVKIRVCVLQKEWECAKVDLSVRANKGESVLYEYFGV